MSEYLSDLENADYFQDMSLGFHYFNDFHINHVSDILNEEKYFSFTKLIQNSFYSQMQAAYVVTYIVLLFANIYILKFDTTVSFFKLLLTYF